MGRKPKQEDLKQDYRLYLHLNKKQMDKILQVKTMRGDKTLTNAALYMMFDEKRGNFISSPDGESKSLEYSMAELYYPQVKQSSSRIIKHCNTVEKQLEMRKADGSPVMDDEKILRNLDSLLAILSFMNGQLNQIFCQFGYEKRLPVIKQDKGIPLADIHWDTEDVKPSVQIQDIEDIEKTLNTLVKKLKSVKEKIR